MADFNICKKKRNITVHLFRYFVVSFFIFLEGYIMFASTSGYNITRVSSCIVHPLDFHIRRIDIFFFLCVIFQSRTSANQPFLNDTLEMIFLYILYIENKENKIVYQMSLRSTDVPNLTCHHWAPFGLHLLYHV